MRRTHLISLFAAFLTAGLFVSEATAVPASVRTAKACKPGSPACPIEVRMARGTDTITVRGVVTPQHDCCAYALRARAGQVMTWRIAGPAVRTGIVYPSGQGKGPGVPTSIRLPQSGVYLFLSLIHI